MKTVLFIALISQWSCVDILRSGDSRKKLNSKTALSVEVVSTHFTFVWSCGAMSYDLRGAVSWYSGVLVAGFPYMRSLLNCNHM